MYKSVSDIGFCACTVLIASAAWLPALLCVPFGGGAVPRGLTIISLFCDYAEGSGDIASGEKYDSGNSAWRVCQDRIPKIKIEYHHHHYQCVRLNNSEGGLWVVGVV